jgi:N-methylhydantoinase A/oxoprolinase/acetone carboxylase beta subunit
VDLNELNAAIGLMESKALSELAVEGYPPERVLLNRSVDVRYIGQGFELTLPLQSGKLNSSSLADLECSFSERHEEIYGHRSDGDPVQFVNLRLTALGQRNNQQTLDHHSTVRSQDRKSLAARDAYFKGVGVVATPLIHRDDLTARFRKGPFIVEEYDATVVVAPGWKAHLDSMGNIVIDIDE